jgi:hypothetical protein
MKSIEEIEGHLQGMAAIGKIVFGATAGRIE